MSNFDIRSRWLQNADNAPDEPTATHARVQIFVARRNITEHKVHRSKSESALEVPTFYLAEWVVENWWLLLFEPRKDEDRDESDYLKRHSITAAQAGFPLPGLSIEPRGRGFHLSCIPREAPFANIKFTVDAFAETSRKEVEQVLTKFVSETVDRLRECGIGNNSLTCAWRELLALSDEERRFCELAGSLGIAPTDVSDELAEALRQLQGVLGADATRDFCLAASKQTVQQSVRGAQELDHHLQRASDTRLSELLKVQLPPENYHAPSWRRGKQAAKNVRDKFGIDVKNPRGADIIFEHLHIDTANQAQVSGNSELPFNGAVDRQTGIAKIALLQPELLHRRFSAGRAAYLAWVSAAQSRRLVTNAVTRDQQASRSFAAEMLIPQGYLKSLAGSKGELHYDQVREAARLRSVMPDVAFKQAQNAGIRVYST